MAVNTPNCSHVVGKGDVGRESVDFALQEIQNLESKSDARTSGDGTQQLQADLSTSTKVSLNTMCDIPTEIVLHCLAWLPATQHQFVISTLSPVFKSVANIIRLDDKLWRSLLLQDFPNVCLEGKSCDSFFGVYKMMFRARKHYFQMGTSIRPMWRFRTQSRITRSSIICC
jgi:hypothetical protein